MSEIILHGINTSDLKKLFQEVLDEKLSFVQKPHEPNNRLGYLNRQEVAHILNISLPTLNNWSKSGILQSYRIGNRILYKSIEIDRAIKSVQNIKFRRG